MSWLPSGWKKIIFVDQQKGETAYGLKDLVKDVILNSIEYAGIDNKEITYNIEN